MRMGRPIAAMMLGGGVLVAVAGSADAQGRRNLPPDYVGTVTAESRYGTATVSGPVRRTPRGLLQVRLPGGTWLDCGLSCRETLRRETVDFWQSRGPRADDGPGYVRFGF